MNDYPLPFNAVGVWFDGTGWSVRIPPARGADKGHIIHLTDDETGWKILSSILRERAHGAERIGTKGAPTQHQLMDFKLQLEATNLIKQKKAEEKAKKSLGSLANISLEDLGL